MRSRKADLKMPPVYSILRAERPRSVERAFALLVLWVSIGGLGQGGNVPLRGASRGSLQA